MAKKPNTTDETSVNDIPANAENGQPVVRSALVSEIASPQMGGVRSIIAAHPAQGLTPPRLATLLRESESGDATSYLELAEEIEEKDLHYLGVIQTRKRAVAQLPIEVIAADDSDQAEADAELVRGWIERDTLELELFNILDAIGKGYSATEIVWKLSSSTWMPEKLVWRDPRWFEFDRIDGETLMLRTGQGPKPLPPYKFILHQHQAKSGITIRGGIARAAAWGYLFKNYSIKDWMAFLEAFGTPMRFGRYDNGTAEKDVSFLMNAVAQLGSDAAAVFPKSMDIEFVDGKQGTSPNDMWRSMCDFVDEQVSKAVLGQTNTTDAKSGGLGSGQANVHNEVRGDIERHDARLLAATLNRDLVIPIVLFNHGPRERYPRLRIGRPEEHDIDAFIKAAQAFVPMGLQIGLSTVRERVGIPEPEDGEELLVIEPSVKSPQDAHERLKGKDGSQTPSTALLDPLKSRNGANDGGASDAEQASAINPDRADVFVATSEDGSPNADAIDLLAEEYASDWQPVMSEIVDEAEKLLRTATSMSEVEAGLLELGQRLDSGNLTSMLARATFAARLAGDAAVAADQRQVKQD